MNDEVWRGIAGFPAHAISNLGRVKRVTVSRKGHQPRILKPHLNNMGYWIIDLTKDGVTSKHLVSRLVCAAFHGAPPTPEHHAAHGDGVPMNNRADNLRWATRSQNMEDSRRHGTMAIGHRHGRTASPEKNPRGESHGHSKLTEQDVLAIRSAERMPGSGVVLAAQYAVCPATISMIRAGKIWRHIHNGEPK